MTTESNISKIWSISTGIPFLNYRYGVKLDSGHVIHEVLSLSQFHAVYKIEGSKNISYEYVTTSHETQDLVCAITSLINLSEEKFKGTATNDITDRVIPIFNLIFRENTETAKYYISELTQYINEKPKVSKVIANTFKYTIWLNSENNVEYIYWTNFSHLNLVIAEFTRLRSLGSSFISKKNAI